MNKNKILFAIFVILTGVFSRVFLKELMAIPNFEMITALSLISGSFLGGIFAPLIPLLIIFISDIYFGNSSVFLFTWSAFILIGIFGNFFKRNSKYYLFKISGGGILSVLFFYLWTNFGWWLTSRMYPMTSQGLIYCYVAAIPFLKNQLISALIFTPLLSLIFTLIFEKFLVNREKKYIAGDISRYRSKYENTSSISKIS